MRYVFAEYELDTRLYELRHAGQPCPLEPQVFNVLLYLIQHRERVVTKDELLDQLWPNQFISAVTLNHRVMAARKAIGDSGREQRCIKTLHGRGYRFIAEVRAVEQSIEHPPLAPVIPSAPPPAPINIAAPVALSFERLPQPFVAREAELLHLHQCMAAALRGERQVVFITGEAGIGKTTLVDAFVAHVAATAAVWIGRGQCIEQYGAGEAYLPLLEALGQLGRGPEGTGLVALLHQQAPSWLVQMPALLPAAEQEALQRRCGGTTRERMLRELAEATEALTAERPLVLVLEDLHWSDGATLDWLAYVARRRQAARLLVLGTYRSVEAVVRAHPVRTLNQELQWHGQCTELMLGYLPEEGVAAYLAQRFGDALLPEGLAHVLHQRTNGNPFFLVMVVEELVRQDILVPQTTDWTLQGALETVAVEVPQSVRQLIDQQLAQVSPEAQAILAAASVVGIEFSAAAVAAAVERATEDVEVCCDMLARQGQFVRRRGIAEWPDGTVAMRYGFVHSLYHEVLYERVPVSRRGRWHRQIGARLEAGYETRAQELAAELAMHYERGRDMARAVRYLRSAGEQAMQRSAYQEAMAHFTHALDLLPTLPATLERTEQELQVHMTLGPALIATKGYADPDVARTYRQARELCQQVGETSHLFLVLYGLWVFHLVRAELQTAYDLAEQLLSLAHRQQAPALFLEAHLVLGLSLFYLGDLAPARRHLEQGIALYNPTQHRSRAFLYGQDHGVVGLSFAAWVLWLLGYPDQALQKSQEALSLARELSHPFSLAYALNLAALLRLHRREGQAAQVQAEALIALSVDQGFALYCAHGTILRGGALTAQEQGQAGITQMLQGLEALHTTGAALRRPYYLAVLAEGYAKVQQAREGLTLLTTALEVVHKSAERVHEAELYRLKGELLQQCASDTPQAEACFRHALHIAQRQQAKLLGLRAAMSLSRLWQRQGQRAAARELLAEVYGWFTEGFDTADLQEAKAVLAELA